MKKIEDANVERRVCLQRTRDLGASPRQPSRPSFLTQLQTMAACCSCCCHLVSAHQSSCLTLQLSKENAYSHGFSSGSQQIQHLPHWKEIRCYQKQLVLSAYCSKLHHGYPNCKGFTVLVGDVEKLVWGAKCVLEKSQDILAELMSYERCWLAGDTPLLSPIPSKLKS